MRVIIMQETSLKTHSTDTVYAIKLKQAFVESFSDNTRIAYQSAITLFQEAGFKVPATPEKVVDYLKTARVWKKKEGVWIQTQQLCSIATLNLHLAAIGAAHEFLSLTNPCKDILVKKAMQALKKQRTVAQKQAKPLLKEDIIAMIKHSTGHETKKARDEALLLVGFTGAFRRAELAAIKIEDLQWTEEGMTIAIPRSKTDQLGEGRKVAIPYARC